MYPKRFFILVVAIFVTAFVPLLLAYRSGIAVYGLGQGFLMPLHEPWTLALVMGIGFAAAWLGRSAVLVVPVSLLLLYVAGASLHIDAAQYSALRLFLLGSILLFGLTVRLAPTPLLFGLALVAGSLGYHLGLRFLAMGQEVASPMLYLVGQLLAMLLAQAVAVSLGMIIFSFYRYYILGKEK